MELKMVKMEEIGKVVVITRYILAFSETHFQDGILAKLVFERGQMSIFSLACN
jgi:hypothetical protein